MSRLFRPSALILITVSFALTAWVLVFWPSGRTTTPNRAEAQPVPAGDQEIAWLNPATSSVAWERFVAAVHRLPIDRPDLAVRVVADANAFPSQTTAVPELALTVGRSKARLWFRWYKLTGDLSMRQWVQALDERRPPPLAVIGGSSTDRASALAEALEDSRTQVAAPPLFLITTATADLVEGKRLMSIYPGRTLRFCFTNRQMAEAVADFVWSQDDLRPDAEPLYLVKWWDDPFSEDLCNQFHEVLGPDGFGQTLQRSRLIKAAARHWAWLAGRVALGGVPPGLDVEGLCRDEVQPPPLTQTVGIPYSVGTFSQPNRWEAEAAEKVMSELDQHPTQRRPLLVLPAVPQPARRFLRALVRTAPVGVRRFVVATGDGIDFSTVYRDRNLAWPIQDLPVSLIFFCHRNPVDPVAFVPDEPGEESQAPDPMGQTSTGSHDLLLYRDIVATLAETAFDDARIAENADQLLAGLRRPGPDKGRERFDEEGNQRSGAGEYVVCLRPVRDGERVRPQARLQVWNRAAAAAGWTLVPVAGGPELNVKYSPGSPVKDERD